MPRIDLARRAAAMVARTAFAAALLGAVASAPAAAQTAAPPTKGPRGDVTLDGVVSAADAQAILYAVVGLPLPSNFAPMPWGDVNGDGRLSALDAQIVVAYVVGLPTTQFAVGAEMSRVTQLAVTPGSAALLPGNTTQLVATPRDSAGATLGDRTVHWVSSDPTIATVSASGEVTALRDGYVSITAVSEQTSATTFIGVGAITAAACGIAGQSGTPHGGVLNADQTWTRAASPHYVGADLLVDGAVLTIEPGAGVCAAPGVMLSFNNGARLSALGSAQLPISFGAADPAQPWRGFVFDGAPADASYLHAVSVSNAGAKNVAGRSGAIVSLGSHTVSLDSALFRQTSTRALDLGAPATVRRTVVDTTLVQGDGTSWFAILLRSTVTLDSVSTLSTNGPGLGLLGAGVVATLRDVTVDGASTEGIGAYGGVVTSATRVRVRNSLRPFAGTVDLFAAIAPTPAEQADLLGNQRDTVRIEGGLLRGRTLSLTRALPLAVYNGFNVDSGGVLMMRSGARIAFGDTVGITVNQRGRLDARGTATDSVVFSAIDSTRNWGPILFENTTLTDTNFVRYAKVEFGGVRLPTGVSNSRGTLDPAFEADFGTTIIDSSSFRKYGGLALYLDDFSTLRAVSLDSGIVNGIAAVFAAGNATVEDVVVTRASDVGFYLNPRAGALLKLRGALTVDGSSDPTRPAVNLVGTGTPATVSNTATITVRNARGYPVGTTPRLFNVLLRDSVAQSAFLGNGNAKDTILVSGTNAVANDTITMFPQLAWRIATNVSIGAGSLLRVRRGARLAIADSQAVFCSSGGRLFARGSATLPVRFSALNPAGFFSGLVFQNSPTDSSYLSNALIERGGYFSTTGAVASSGTHAVVMDSVRIRQSRYAAVVLGGAGSRLTRSIIDTTQNTFDAGGVGTNAVTISASNVTVEDDTIRAPAGGGIQVTGAITGTRIIGGRIIGGGLTALFITANASRQVFAQFVAPRITGAFRGVSVPANLLSTVARDSAMVSNYVGNVRDTIAVGFSPNLFRDTVVFTSVLPYRSSSYIVADTVSLMDLRPGVRLAFADSQGFNAQNGARIVARGTPSRPVTFTGVSANGFWSGFLLSGAPGDTSVFTNTLIERAGYFSSAIFANESHPVVIDSTRIRRSRYFALRLDAPGSRLSRSTIDTTVNALLPSGSAALAVQALGANVTIEGTTIRGAAGGGVLMAGDGSRWLGGAILGTGTGTGFFFNNTNRFGLAAWSPPVISGGAGYPIAAGSNLLTVVAHDSAMMAKYTGNARDTIDVFGIPTYRDTVPFNPGMPYRIRQTVVADTNSVLLVRPGARVAVAAGAQLVTRNGARLDARGTASRSILLTALDPTPGVTWNGISLQGVPQSDSSRIAWALVERAGTATASAIVDQSTHPLIVTNSRLRQSRFNGITLGAGSRIDASIIDTTGAGGTGVIVNSAGSSITNSIVRGAGGIGVQVTGVNALFSAVTIEGAGTDLLQVTANAPSHSIFNLNLTGYGLNGTGGVAVRNSDPVVNGQGLPAPLTLTGTWWGSPSGPPPGSTAGAVTANSNNTNGPNAVTPVTP